MRDFKKSKKDNVDDDQDHDVIENPQFNCYGDVTYKSGVYNLAKGKEENYCVSLGNFERPVKVEAWVKGNDDSSKVSVSLFNDRNKDDTGYTIRTSNDDSCVFEASSDSE